MAKVAFKGNPVHTVGDLPKVGEQAPDFSLVGDDLSQKTLADFKGKNVILNIFPSIDTGTCAASVRNFNEKAASSTDSVVLCISRDLPFAQGRFCAAEGLDNVIMLSEYKDNSFSDAYGVRFSDGPLDGLLSRAVVVIGKDGKVQYVEQVAEIADEPNYDAALTAL